MNDINTALPIESFNGVDDRLTSFKELFPESFSDGKINIEKLREVIGEMNLENGQERFGLTWPGKRNSILEAQLPTTATLKPVPEESVNFDTTKNIFIESDNLLALKILQRSYQGKIKMIYIDPPYNTGKEFIYPDNYQEGLQDYLKYTGQKTEEGKSTEVKQETAGRKHSKWLSMMRPRLTLARNLLREDGVIFISIDDNELSNLLMILKDIFGEENFVGIFPWRSRTAKADVPFGVSIDVEWVVSFAKSNKFISGREGERKYYKTDDFDDRWRLQDCTTNKTREERPNSYFTMINPKNGEEFPANDTRTWSVTVDTFDDYYKRGKIVFPGDYDFLKIKRPAFRVFENEDKQKAIQKFGNDEVKMSISTYLPEKDIGRTEHGTKEIRELFGQQVFSYPKPTSIIKHFVSCIDDPNALILDFFAGSATTAHAVYELNAQDGGNRRFILVQLPEKCDKNSDAYKAGYETISEIGKERIRLASKKVASDFKESITERNKPIDFGFKVFKLIESNFKEWDPGENPTEETIEQSLLDFSNHTKEESKPQDLLYEFLLRTGLPLDVNISEAKIESKTLYSIQSGQILAYLHSEGVTEEFVDQLLESNPTRLILLDSAFHGQDELKANVHQKCKIKNVTFNTL